MALFLGLTACEGGTEGEMLAPVGGPRIRQCVPETSTSASALIATGCSVGAYGGRAIGVDAKLLLSGVTAADSSELPAAGGTKSSTSVSVAVLGLSTGVATSSVKGEEDATVAASTVHGLNLSIAGIGISADDIAATATASCDARTGSAVISGLRVAGSLIPITGATNQTVNAGLVRVVINERHESASGVLSVRALHITGPATDITVSLARASIVCSCAIVPPPPPPPPPPPSSSSTSSSSSTGGVSSSSSSSSTSSSSSSSSGAPPAPSSSSSSGGSSSSSSSGDTPSSDSPSPATGGAGASANPPSSVGAPSVGGAGGGGAGAFCGDDVPCAPGYRCN